MIDLFIYLAVCIYLIIGTTSRGLTSARLDLNRIGKAKREGKSWYIDGLGNYRTCNGNKLLLPQTINGDRCLILPNTNIIIHNFTSTKCKQDNQRRIKNAIRNKKIGYPLAISNYDRNKLFPNSGNEQIYQLLNKEGKPITTFYIPSFCNDEWLFFDIATKTWEKRHVEVKDQIKMK